jgi:protein-S-isoprenylcysteine O-methyltransferase Ste14
MEVPKMQKMTLWGIGPTLALVTLTYTAATAVLSQGRPEFAIDIVPRTEIVAVGIVLVFRSLIAKEEQYLRTKFGESYLDYQKRVPLILPLGWLRGDP